MELNVKISFSQETLNIISSLVGALSGRSAVTATNAVTPKVAEQPIQQIAPVAPVQQQQYIAPVAQQTQQPVYDQQPQQQANYPSGQGSYVAPQQQVPQQQMAGVPTTGQSYSMEQLAVAATQLVDAGRRNDLVNLLSSFGVQALTVLPKEQYGAFATQLRAMGAKI